MNEMHFDTEAFFLPESRYYPVYSWMWNEALTRAEIQRQLDEMYERSIRGVYVIPLPKEFRPDTMTTNLQPEYLSDGYFEMLAFAAAYAKEKGMSFWLYDEGGWPSGNANGLVTEGDKRLKLKHVENGRVKAVGRADLTNIRATEKFISLTHEKHKEKTGEAFGSFGPLVFTDEPDIKALPFTESIKTEYKRRTGQRLSLRKLKKHSDPEFNITYHDICARVFAENYFLPIKRWCNDNGLMSAGHLDKDNEAYGFKKSFHHPLRLLRLLDVPGVDVIWGQIEPDKDCGFFPRLASSAAEQNGSGLSLTESLSVYGTMTYEQMRYVLGYQLVRGINILNFMLVMYDEKGYYAVRQRPAFSEKLPDAEFLPEFNRYTASLQYLMQRGLPATDCALYLPIRSLWADDKDTETAMEVYEALGRSIEENHGQFDIIDDDLILGCDGERIKSGILSMGRAEYKTVYVPADKYMPDEVKSRLEAFTKGGGRIYRKDNAEFFPALDISGDNGKLRVHKRKYDGCEIYLIFNESAEAVNAQLRFPEGTRELDFLSRRVYSAKALYRFEGGEIRVFLSSAKAEGSADKHLKGKKICTLTDFRIRRLRQFTLDASGMSCKDTEDTETAAGNGDWSDLYGEAFSGKCQYTVCFDCNGAKNLILSLGRVFYSCEVILNGKKITDLLMPPYEVFIDKALLKAENELVINVTNTAANAFVHFDLPKDWEQKHIGPYHTRALELEKKLLHGGLLGPVEIFEAE